MSVETVDAIEEMLRERHNGAHWAPPNESQGTHLPMRQWPQELRRLIDGPLPFNELEEAVLGLAVGGELVEDVLAQIDEHIGPGEPWDQLRTGFKLQRFYVARLVNLWRRIERGDEDTI